MPTGGLGYPIPHHAGRRVTGLLIRNLNHNRSGLPSNRGPLANSCIWTTTISLSYLSLQRIASYFFGSGRATIDSMDTLREHLRKIGSIKSPRKRLTSQQNGKLGGRPKGKASHKPNVQGFAQIGRTSLQDSATS